MHPWHHARSSVKRYGGVIEDYLPIHQWFDQSKSGYNDPRHRAMLHHSEGIFLCEKMFGVIIRNADGKEIPVRVIGEQHVREDMGFVPSLKDWMKMIKLEKWAILTPQYIPELEEEPTEEEKKKYATVRSQV